MGSDDSQSESGRDMQTTPDNKFSSRRQKTQKRQRESDYDQLMVDLTKIINDKMALQMIEIRKNTQMLEDIKNTNRSIEASVTFLSAQYEDSRAKIEKLEADAVEDRKYIATLENKIADLQRDGRKTSLEIRNVPTVKNETKENLISMVCCLGQSIDCPIEKTDIKDIYQIKNKKEQAKTSTVILETSSTLQKQDMLQKCKSFNLKKSGNLSAKHLGLRSSPDIPIFVAEHLTPQAARLHFLARELKKAKLFKYCWTSNGKVYLRQDDNSPIIAVSNESQIERLGKEGPLRKKTNQGATRDGPSGSQDN